MTSIHRRAAVSFAFALSLGACGREAATSTPSTSAPATSAPTAAQAGAAAREPNRLDLRLDGQPWRADRAIEAIVDAPGFDGLLILSGSFGPKDRNEQTFNLNLSGVKGPGTYRVRGGSVTNAVQLGNLSTERYLIGGALGADVEVVVHTLQRNPLVVEATFSGTLLANDGKQVRLEDGRFSYRE